MKTILALFAAIALLTSCEDIIEVNLNTIESTLVIEGCINDLPGPCTIKLSKTGDYFDPDVYPAVSGAVVSITDEHGLKTILEESEAGHYISESLEGIEKTGYTLDVWSEEEHYTADVTMPQKVHIEYITSEIPPPMFDFEDGYMVSCYLQDPAGQKDYYRMKAYTISDQSEARESEYVFNDVFQDGNLIIMQWELEPFFPYDTVVVEMQTLDKATYDYYRTLFPIVGDDLLGAANPSNPETNLSNGALGYFGTYTVSRDTIIVMPAE